MEVRIYADLIIRTFVNEVPKENVSIHVNEYLTRKKKILT